MSTYSDYTFYSEEYHGHLDEAAFDASVRTAHAEIVSQTSGRADHAPEHMKEAVQLCECELVDVIDAYKKSAALLPKGVGSVSNDGYTVSVGAGAASSEETKDRRIVCSRYLQWPVNLMYRGI